MTREMAFMAGLLWKNQQPIAAAVLLYHKHMNKYTMPPGKKEGFFTRFG